MAIFSSFDGLNLQFEVEGSGPPVVLLHGFASSYDINWRRPGSAGELVAAGHQVIGLNARGHGMSDKPHDPVAYAHRAMAKDVTALLDHLSLERADVAGYSMGALTAFALAQDDNRVGRLVLGGIGGFADRLERDWTPQWERRPELIAEALETDKPELVVDPMARRFRRFADRNRCDRQALAALQRSHSILVLPGDPTTVRCPTLVVSGDKDDPPYALAKMLPDARVAIVKGTHLSAVLDPGFAQVIVRFLAG